MPLRLNVKSPNVMLPNHISPNVSSPIGLVLLLSVRHMSSFHYSTRLQVVDHLRGWTIAVHVMDHRLLIIRDLTLATPAAPPRTFLVFASALPVILLGSRLLRGLLAGSGSGIHFFAFRFRMKFQTFLKGKTTIRWKVSRRIACIHWKTFQS